MAALAEAVAEAASAEEDSAAATAEAVSAEASEAVRAPVDSEVRIITITIITVPISAGVGVPDIITSAEEADASVLLQVWYSLQFSSYLC